MDCAWRQGTAPMNPMLLQHTLRGLCSNESQWVYAVFWRILPRNYPPPQWDTESGIMDRSKGNKRNWILLWEDGYCNFSACAAGTSSSAATTDSRGSSNSFLSVRQQDEEQELTMNPELFFKMSHEVYNYGEGLMGKVAVDNSHKWVCREPLDNEIGFLSSPWQNSIDPHPRTWEGQFKSGIQTIAVVAVHEGVLQLGSTQKIMEDLNLVLYIQRKFNFLHSIPGVFVPHPTSGDLGKRGNSFLPLDSMPFSNGTRSIDQFLSPRAPVTGMKRPPESIITSGLLNLKDYNNTNSYSQLNGYDQCRPECPSPPKVLHTGLHGSPQGTTSPPTNLNMSTLLPSMSSLQALLSKLPSVTVPHDNNGGVPRTCSYPSNGRFEINGVGNGVTSPISHGCDMQRMMEGEAMLPSTTADVSPNFRPEKPRYVNNSMFDSLDNFTEFGIQEALENGDSSYTSFLNEICS